MGMATASSSELLEFFIKSNESQTQPNHHFDIIIRKTKMLCCYHVKARFNGFSICPTFVQQKLNGCWENVG